MKRVLSGSGGRNEESRARWNRFPMVSGIFVAFETILIVVFGDYFFTGVSSELGASMMVGIAAFGYLLLGLFCGWPSILIVWMPLAIVLALDPAIPAEAWGSSRRLPLDVIWLMLSIIFLPAWGLGALLGSLIPNRPRSSTPKAGTGRNR